ncbi:MAG TPA: 3-oxoacyl-ACP synthase [Alphaproteobacteria bacterium]|nr:3-oxoacyl-ACP synthase [Alphaproteobacteria bacterium]HAM47898.1 3-oxoacyl-ACP synthase [Alphaproteobacteria bacterium]HBA44220.1 3-oxoacyl-ACP synthase [Alphaproteobacteria bacterium]HBF98257.1 3-oxoacyl-ACP synthase [Alphaproteobacteria bacterium]HCO90860.1 3-oxoacyl-ACP synthase [Alphaproteobacteria bacterium]
MIRSVVTGIGSYLPAKTLTNAELSQMVDTSDDWIVERSGIRERHIVADGELTSDMAIAAAKQALEAGGIAAEEIDLIVLATATPDQTFPATATRVQAALGVTKGAAFDIQAVCSGFIYALSVADNFLKAGQFRNALVIGAESFSKILDWEDRTTCVLFGDGAGAFVLSARPGNGTADDRGILSSHLHADGRYNDMLYVDGGPSSTGTTGHVRMNGREVFRHAVTNMAAVVRETLEANGLGADDIDWVVPHQANKRIIDATAKKLGVPEERVVQTVALHGNTSAASVPLAVDCALRDGRIKQGDLVLMEAMGGGFTWGATLVRW